MAESEPELLEPFSLAAGTAGLMIQVVCEGGPPLLGKDGASNLKLKCG